MNQELIDELEGLLDSEQLAKRLRLSIKSIYNLKHKGVLRARRYLRRRPLFDLEESLERYNKMKAEDGETTSVSI